MENFPQDKKQFDHFKIEQLSKLSSLLQATPKNYSVK